MLAMTDQTGMQEVVNNGLEKAFTCRITNHRLTEYISGCVNQDSHINPPQLCLSFTAGQKNQQILKLTVKKRKLKRAKFTQVNSEHLRLQKHVLCHVSTLYRPRASDSTLFMSKITPPDSTCLVCHPHAFHVPLTQHVSNRVFLGFGLVLGGGVLGWWVFLGLGGGGEWFNLMLFTPSELSYQGYFSAHNQPL